MGGLDGAFGREAFDCAELALLGGKLPLALGSGVLSQKGCAGQREVQQDGLAQHGKARWVDGIPRSPGPWVTFWQRSGLAAGGRSCGAGEGDPQVGCNPVRPSNTDPLWDPRADGCAWIVRTWMSAGIWPGGSVRSGRSGRLGVQDALTLNTSPGQARACVIKGWGPTSSRWGRLPDR